jgi:hypothetical protein
MKLRLLDLVLATALLTTAAHPQDRAAVCSRGEGVFYGTPITLEQVFVIPGQAEPAVPSGDDLFPDPGTDAAYTGPSCEGGGLVGAIDCVAETIEGSGTATTETAVPAVEAEARAAVAGEAESGEAEPGDGTATPGVKAEPRVVRQILVLKPVLVPGAPGRVSYVPDGPGGLEVPEDLTEAEVAAVSPMVSARNAALLSYQGELSLAMQDDLIRGMPVPLPTPPLPDGVSLAGDPGVLAMGAECGALFRAMTETARLLQLRAEKVARIAQLKEMLKAERDKAGLLGIFWDSEQADRLEGIIAFEEGNLRKIDARLGEHKATIDRRERWLENEDRAREVDAIKADPDRLAAETQRRRDAIVEAAQEAARARWLMIEGEAAYARQLAAHDAMIKAARENGQDDLADKLEEDKTRLEAARDSWREHAQSMIDVRVRDQARLMQENAADGIGPVGDASSILLAEGKNPIEVIETGAREGARASAERRALTDATTLGGAATEQYDLVDFGQDLFETNLEMQTNPALFYSRFGSYLGGAAEAAYDGVVDLAVIGVEAGDLAGEAFESGLSDVTGYEFNAFGRENIDTLVSAGTALSETDALKLGELAGRVAEAADRRVSQMAGSGEAGIREALATTGYVTASVLGAEEIAMAGSVRIASAVRDAARGAEALADVSKLAEGVTDASRLADAAKLDAPKLDVPVTPNAPAPAIADDLTDTVKVDPEDLTETVKIDPPKPDAPTTPDAEDLTDTVKIDPPKPDAPVTPDAPDLDKTGPVDPPTPDAPTTPDAEDLTETVKIDPSKPDAPVTPDAPDPDKTGPVEPLDPDKTGPVDPPKPDAPVTPEAPDPDKTGLVDHLDPDKTGPVDPPKPDAPVTPDAPDLDKTGPVDPPTPVAPTTPDAEDLTETVKIDPPKPDAPITPDVPEPITPDAPDLDKTGPVDPPKPDAPRTPDAEDLTETVKIDPPKPDAPVTPDAPDADDLTKTVITDPPSPDAPSTPDISDASRTDIGAPDPALLRPVKRADAPSVVDDAVDAAAGKPPTPDAPPPTRAVPPTPQAQIDRLGEVIDASSLTPDQKAFFKKLAKGRTPEEAAARAIIDGGLNPSDILSSGVLSKDDLRRGVLGYLDEYSGLTPEAARLFADRTVGGVRDTLAKLGVDNSVIKVFEAKLGKFSPEHALASGAWNQGVSPLRLIDEAGVAEADIRRGLDEYLQLERGIDDPRKRARLIEDYMRPVTDRAAAAAAGIPPIARIPEGAPTIPVAAKTPDGRDVPLVMEAAPFKEGSYNEIYRLGPPFEGKVARRSKTPGDTPEAKIDEFGRTALADPAVSPDIVRPQDRTLLTGPDGRKLEILPFEGRTAESQIAKNPGGVPTPGQTIALDQAMRELNKAGYAWLDNHIGNYLFEPVPGLADEWRILVLDPGGIVKVADGSAETARDIQLQLARLDETFLGNVTKTRAAGYSIEETRGALANAHTARSEGLKEVLLPQLDTGFGGTDDLAAGLQFRVDGLAYFPDSRNLIELGDEGLDAAYDAMRVAAE